MNKWEKPVLSVLGIDKTKGGNMLKILSGVPAFDNDLFTTENVEGAIDIQSVSDGDSDSQHVRCSSHNPHS